MTQRISPTEVVSAMDNLTEDYPAIGEGIVLTLQTISFVPATAILEFYWKVRTWAQHDSRWKPVLAKLNIYFVDRLERPSGA